MKNHFGCPVQATSNVFSGKWKVLIVWQLSFGSRRFAQLRDILPGVSEKVLTAQLRALEADGVVEVALSNAVASVLGEPIEPSHIRFESE